MIFWQKCVKGDCVSHLLYDIFKRWAEKYQPPVWKSAKTTSQFAVCISRKGGEGETAVERGGDAAAETRGSLSSREPCSLWLIAISRGRCEEIRCLFIPFSQKNHQANSGGEHLVRQQNFEEKMWAKQDHITKISINMSLSEDFSLKRSDWTASSFCPRALLSQSRPSFLHFTVIRSHSLHPLLFTLTLYYQSATLHCSPQSPLSLTSLCSPALPFSTPSYFSPEPSFSVSTALPFRPFVSPTPTPPSLWQPLH